MIGLLLFGIPAAIIAGFKGFKWGRWILALGIIGFIWVIFLKSAKAKDISSEEDDRRAEKANTTGAWLAGINIGLTIIVLRIALNALEAYGTEAYVWAYGTLPIF